ncbi:V-set and immunoglobulin domain-containing protein 4, partial [Eschrichtius robustus]|nr:V-set and immunoglobulin domain-containing protein 4 [Eschrichtius robustus]
MGFIFKATTGLEQGDRAGSPYTSQFLSGREASNPNTLVVIAISTVNSSQGWTTEVDGYVGKTSAGPGNGLPIFAIILIISFCCIVVTTMTYIMVCRKTSQQEHVCEVARVHAEEASDPGETMRVAIFTSGCSSEEPASQTLDNDYSDEPCLGQEYQIIAQINGDYARLLHTVPPDYELLFTKGKSSC